MLRAEECLFPVGLIVATPGALAALKESAVPPLMLLARHVSGDWGELDSHDGRTIAPWFPAVGFSQRIEQVKARRSGLSPKQTARQHASSFRRNTERRTHE